MSASRNDSFAASHPLLAWLFIIGFTAFGALPLTLMVVYHHAEMKETFFGVQRPVVEGHRYAPGSPRE